MEDKTKRELVQEAIKLMVMIKNKLDKEAAKGRDVRKRQLAVENEIGNLTKMLDTVFGE